MADPWGGLPSTGLIVLGVIVLLVALAIDTLGNVIFHGIWVLFGGRPEKAHERMEMRGGGPGIVYVIAVIGFILIILFLGVPDFLVVGSVVAIIAFSLAGIMRLVSKYEGADGDLSAENEVAREAVTECPACSGTGSVHGEPCMLCSGKGFLNDRSGKSDQYVV